MVTKILLFTLPYCYACKDIECTINYTLANYNTNNNHKQINVEILNINTNTNEDYKNIFNLIMKNRSLCVPVVVLMRESEMIGFVIGSNHDKVINLINNI